jgi:hypothetical protein
MTQVGAVMTRRKTRQFVKFSSTRLKAKQKCIQKNSNLQNDLRKNENLQNDIRKNGIEPNDIFQKRLYQPE